jgi:hypothetical protein
VSVWLQCDDCEPLAALLDTTTDLFAAAVALNGVYLPGPAEALARSLQAQELLQPVCACVCMQGVTFPKALAACNPALRVLAARRRRTLARSTLL